MKKAALPSYTLLVIGLVACLQADENLNVLNLTAYVSGNQIGNPGKSTNTIIVSPKIFACYNPGKSAAYSLTTGPYYNCCKLALADSR